MDAKERASFINSVGNTTENTAKNAAENIADNTAGKKCPKCGAENVEEAMFCASCGTPLHEESQKADMTEPAFQSVQEEVQQPVQEAPKESVRQPVQEASQEKVQQPVQEVPQEPESAFAKGLPEWDMVPPQVMIRRKGMRS